MEEKDPNATTESEANLPPQLRPIGFRVLSILFKIGLALFGIFFLIYGTCVVLLRLK